ncbi:MAG: hypothetical protein KAR20_02165, partial [Candidatus Heimdallarchaeota archaeon]|nr:hypothetical protein [Candidatus Heimdallarchaeota archaeon]
NDRILVKYFYDGDWLIAGDVLLAEEISNAKNGGYFSFALPEYISWELLYGLRVSFEYNGAQSAGSVAYLDSVWLDVTYQGDEDISSGENVQDILLREDESLENDILVVSESEKIVFGYSDENDGEMLIMKTEHSSYKNDIPAQVYFNVTNNTDINEKFNLQFYLPQSDTAGSMVLEKWFKNVPYEVTAQEYGDTAYLCADGWQNNIDEENIENGTHACETDSQYKTCDSFNEDKTNCIVEDQKIGEHVEIEYRNEFKEVSLMSEFSRDISGGLFSSGIETKTIPSSFGAVSVTEESHLIGPGQTLYFHAEILQDETLNNEFYIEAIGTKTAYGLIGPARSFVGVVDNGNLGGGVIENDKEINDDLLVKKDFLINSDLSLVFKYNSQKGFWNKLIKGPAQEGDFVIKKVVLKHASSEDIEVAVERVVYGENNEWSISLERYRDVNVPGKYTLEVEVEEGGEIYIDKKDFYWGVLAINTNKATFTPNETAYVQMGVLSDTGNTICDAELILTVTDPTGVSHPLYVERSGLCDGNNVVEVPDYFAYFDTTATGTYRMELVHFDEDGSILHDIVDSFEVWDEVSFDVERVGPTRIYPPSPYTVELSIEARKDFSGEIIEALPEGFIVLDTN